MISFVIPAHNEEACLPATLQAIHDSARATGQPYEIIVVDDASTDATAEIARQHKARVVSVNHRQIAATRNSGGRAANGERIIFIDADTTANPRVVAAALRALDKGAVGGGAPTWVGKGEALPLYIRLFCWPALLLPGVVGFSGGAFMFCTREAFAATGGFDERLYWSEEAAFSLALRREGRFAGLWQWAITSGRRARKVSGMKFLAGFARIIFSPVKMFTQRAAVQTVWYDSNRTDDDKMPDSLFARLSNLLALLIIAAVLTEGFWGRLPWSWTPLSTPFGKIRLLAQLSICHIGLLFWVPALILLVNLFRQKHWNNLLQSAVVIAFCSEVGWSAAAALSRMWPQVYHWLV